MDLISIKLGRKRATHLEGEIGSSPAARQPPARERGQMDGGIKEGIGNEQSNHKSPTILDRKRDSLKSLTQPGANFPVGR